MEPEVLSIKEVAQYLNVGVQTAYKLVRSGELPGVKVGREWRVHKEVIDEFLKRPVSKK